MHHYAGWAHSTPELSDGHTSLCESLSVLEDCPPPSPAEEEEPPVVSPDQLEDFKKKKTICRVFKNKKKNLWLGVGLQVAEEGEVSGGLHAWSCFVSRPEFSFKPRIPIYFFYL